VRAAFFFVLAGCGRVAFDSHDAGASSDAMADAEFDPGFVRFPMDLDPAGGMIEAIPASRSVACGAMCPLTSTDHMVGTAAFRFNATVRPVIGQLLPAAGSPYTFTVWMRPDSGVVFGSAISKTFDDASGGLNEISIVVTDMGVWYEGARSGVPVTVVAGGDYRNMWRHFAFVFDGTDRHVYVDTILATSGPGPWETSNAPIALGADDDGAGINVPYGGLMDDLRFYPRALTSTEISTIHAER
jgi:Concanavalin A-like lectin/glucanases superfamily